MYHQECLSIDFFFYVILHFAKVANVNLKPYSYMYNVGNFITKFITVNNATCMVELVKQVPNNFFTQVYILDFHINPKNSSNS